MKILEPSMALYYNQWFTIPKKFRALRFIEDVRLVNKMIIKNKELELIMDKVAQAFIRHTIYYIKDLYFDYN